MKYIIVFIYSSSLLKYSMHRSAIKIKEKTIPVPNILPDKDLFTEGE